MSLRCRLTERFNQTFNYTPDKAQGDDWDDHIDPVLFGYGVNMQASTKYLPFELMYGVSAKLPIDLDSADCDASDDVIQDRF